MGHDREEPRGPFLLADGQGQETAHGGRGKLATAHGRRGARDWLCLAGGVYELVQTVLERHAAWPRAKGSGTRVGVPRDGAGGGTARKRHERGRGRAY